MKNCFKDWSQSSHNAVNYTFYETYLTFVYSWILPSGHLRKFKEQFKKISFIVQEQGSKTGHELLLKCSRTAQEHFLNVKLDKF